MTEMIKMEQHQPTKMEAQDEDEVGDNMDENINFENKYLVDPPSHKFSEVKVLKNCSIEYFSKVL